MSGYRSKSWFSSTNFLGNGGRPPTTVVGVRNLESLGYLSHGVVCVILRLAVLIQYRRVTDTQTDT